MAAEGATGVGGLSGHHYSWGNLIIRPLSPGVRAPMISLAPGRLSQHTKDSEDFASSGDWCVAQVFADIEAPTFQNSDMNDENCVNLIMDRL